MSKLLKVEKGGYAIKVEAGADITLDTSRNTQAKGNVWVFGNLVVNGSTTTIEATNSYITDNILTLNEGETGSGVTLLTAGIEINRGSESYAQFLFDESESWITGGLTGMGVFKFVLQNGSVVPIKTNSIQSPGTLYINTSGVISVTGTTNYEEGVFNYVPIGGGQTEIQDLGGGVVLDNDTIPNTKALVDYFNWAITNVGSTIISDNNTSVQTIDNTTSGLPSKIENKIDGVDILTLYEDKIEFPSIRIEETTISTYNSNADLTLSAPGTGVVNINDTLQITETPGQDDIIIDPSTPTNGVKLYSKTEGYGNTGLYFVNKSATNDELVSSRKSLVYSMIF